MSNCSQQKVSLPGVPLYFPFFVMDYLICPVLRKQKPALGGRRFESSHYRGCSPLRTSGRRGSWLHSVLAPVGTQTFLPGGPPSALFLSVEASTPHLVSLFPFLMAGPGTVVWMLSVQHRLMGLSCWFSASGSGSQWTL